MRVHYSDTNKLWYINCPRCGVTHAFGLTHGFNGDYQMPTLTGSIGWTGVASEGEVIYCHSIIENGAIKFDDGYKELLPEF